MIGLTTSMTKAPFDKPWGNYLLDNLVETQVPQSISWLPQTLGWKILTILSIVLLIQKIYSTYQNYQSNAYRREALRWIEQYQKTADTDFYKQLSSLLKKTALYAYKRKEVSQLTGSKWEHWLDQQCQQTSFVTSCPDVLHQLAYMPISPLCLQTERYRDLLEQITLWIKHHRGCSNV